MIVLISYVTGGHKTRFRFDSFVRNNAQAEMGLSAMSARSMRIHIHLPCTMNQKIIPWINVSILNQLVLTEVCENSRMQSLDFRRSNKRRDNVPSRRSIKLRNEISAAHASMCASIGHKSFRDGTRVSSAKSSSDASSDSHGRPAKWTMIVT